MSTRRSQFYVNDTNLTIAGVRWVTDEHRMHGPQNFEMEQITLPGRDGEIPMTSTLTYGAATWTVHMSIQGNSYDQLLERKASLERLLTPPRRLSKIVEEVTNEAGTVVRTLEAYGYLTGSEVERPWNSPADGIDVVYTFRIPSGVWLEPPVTQSFTGTGEKTISAALGGSAPQHDVVFTLRTSSRTVAFHATSSNDGNPTNQDDNYLWYSDSSNLPGRVIELRARDNTAVYQASPLPILVNNNFDAGSGHFYIHNGKFNITAIQGISDVTVTTRRAWY